MRRRSVESVIRDLKELSVRQGYLTHDQIESSLDEDCSVDEMDEIYIALEIIKRRCEEYDDLKEFPGSDIANLMVAFSEKYLNQPA